MKGCISPVMVRKGLFVPCSKCQFCLREKAREWSFRMSEEYKVSTSGYFLTLTYDDAHLPRYLPEEGYKAKATLVKLHIDKFIQDVRNWQRRLYPPTRNVKSWNLSRKEIVKKAAVRYFLVGEYGGRYGRPHYHVVIFNVGQKVVDKFQDIWSRGHVDVGTVTEKSTNYVAGYVNLSKEDNETGRELPFSRKSQGLGRSYLSDKVRMWHKSNLRNYRVLGPGVYGRLPRYFKDRIFNKHEKEQMRRKYEEQSVVEFWTELVRLSAFHADAFKYLEEVHRWNHERIKIKAIKRKLHLV